MLGLGWQVSYEDSCLMLRIDLLAKLIRISRSRSGDRCRLGAIGVTIPLMVCFWLTHRLVRADDVSTPSRSVASESTRAEIESSLKEQFQSLWNGMSPDARAGYHHLVDKAYLPPDFDDQVLADLDHVPHTWGLSDSPLTPDSRESTWRAYGLSPRHDEPSKPLQYVVSNDGGYAMNCFACHGGNLFGATYPGAPNTTYALESLIEQVRRIKLARNRPLSHMDLGSVVMPLGRNVGTSNAVMFGVALMNYRDADLNVHVGRPAASMVHHDMDAPPWWHFHRKHHIYIDGFAQKGHRGLMQFMLIRQNGPDKFRAWENDYRQVYQFLSELRAPRYPLAIDTTRAERGRIAFESHCASCHGTYGPKGDYPERLVSIRDVQTDRVRLDALTPKHRAHYGQSWFADLGEQTTYSNVDGYVAPPLDGVWATAPYLHNGSVPTLWHLLHPDERPVIWKRTALGLDTERMGFQIESWNKLPSRLKQPERRLYFDTTRFGKSRTGHDYPSRLTEDEKTDVLEYLKTL